MVGRLSVAALLAGWLLALSMPVAAAGVQVEAVAGFDGLARQGAWLPVRVTLTNEGGDVRTTVRVQRPTEGGVLSVSQPVELPAGVRKHVTLLVLADGFVGPLTVQVLTGEQVLAQTQVEVGVVGSGAILTGVLASTPEAAARVVASLGGRGGSKQTARLTPEDLPANPYALLALDALIINGASTRALTPEQVTALGEWVTLGGTLVLGGGAAAPGVLDGLGDLAPVRLTGPASSVARLPALETLTRTPVEAPGPFVMAAAAPRPAAAVVLAQDGAPVIVTQTMGQGRISFVALDLGLDPLLGWTGASRFWDSLLHASTTRSPAATPVEAGMRLRWALGSGTALDLPAAGQLGLLLLGYIIVIGPLNYLVLRRLDRREWAWVTTPIITVLFTGSLFAIGAGARGGQVVINSMSVVHSASGTSSASVESFIGIFVPGRANHTLRLPAGTLISGTPDVDRGPGSPTPPLQIWQGSTVEVRDLPFAAADFKTFIAQGSSSDPVVAADLRLEGKRLIGSVRNVSGQSLDDAVLLVGQQFQSLGSLAPGASIAVDWPVPDQPPVGLNEMPLSARLNGNRFPDGGSTQDWQQQARFQLLDLLFGSTGERPLTAGVQVLGWQATPPLELAVAGQTPHQQAVTLVRHSIVPVTQPGAVTLPPGLLPRTIESGDDRFAGQASAAGLVLGAGETVVNFSLPATLNTLQAEELVLLVAADLPKGGHLLPAARPGAVAGSETVPPPPAPAPPRAGPNQSVPALPRPEQMLPPGAVRFALYDYQQRTWVELPQAGAGSVVVPAAKPFVSSEGPIRLRITVASGNEPLFLQQLDLGVQGHLP